MKNEKLAIKIYDEVLTEALKSFDKEDFLNRVYQLYKANPSIGLMLNFNNDVNEVVIKDRIIICPYIFENYLIDLLIDEGFYIMVDYSTKYMNYTEPKYIIRLSDDYYIKRCRFYGKDEEREVLNDKKDKSRN